MIKQGGHRHEMSSYLPCVACYVKGSRKLYILYFIITVKQDMGKKTQTLSLGLLVNKPLHVTLAISSVFVGYELVSMPHEINIKGRNKERRRRGRHKVHESRGKKGKIHNLFEF